MDKDSYTLNTVVYRNGFYDGENTLPSNIASVTFKFNKPKIKVFDKDVSDWKMSMDTFPEWWSKSDEKEAWSTLEYNLETSVIDNTNVSKIDGRHVFAIRNSTVTEMIGSTVDDMYDSNIYVVKDSVINSMSGNSGIDNAQNVQIKRICGNSKISKIAGSRVDFMVDNSYIEDASNTNIGTMSDNSDITSISGMSHVSCMGDSAVIRDAKENTDIDTMFDSSKIANLIESSVGHMYDESSVTNFEQGSVIGVKYSTGGSSLHYRVQTM